MSAPRRLPGRSVVGDDVHELVLVAERSTVVKVASKICAFLGATGGHSVGLKCASTREEADEWLPRFPDDAAVMPYIGRSGWNTLLIGGAIPSDELLEALDLSYAAVVSKLPKRERPAAL